MSMRESGRGHWLGPEAILRLFSEDSRSGSHKMGGSLKATRLYRVPSVQNYLSHIA